MLKTKLILFVSLIVLLSCKENSSKSLVEKINDDSDKKTLSVISDMIRSGNELIILCFKKQNSVFFEDRYYVSYYGIVTLTTTNQKITCDSLIFDTKDNTLYIPDEFKILEETGNPGGKNFYWNIKDNSYTIKNFKGTFFMDSLNTQDKLFSKFVTIPPIYVIHLPV